MGSKDDKFVVPYPRTRITLADTLADDLRSACNDHIASNVTAKVVDLLQIVDVDEQGGRSGNRHTHHARTRE